MRRQKSRGDCSDREKQPGLLGVKSRDREKHRDRDKHSDYSSEGRAPRRRAKRKDKSDGYDSTTSDSDSESVRKTSRKYLGNSKKLMSASDLDDDDSSHSLRSRKSKKKKKKKRRRQIEGKRDSITEMSSSSKGGSVKKSKKHKKAVDTSSVPYPIRFSERIDRSGNRREGETISRSRSRKGTKMKLYE